jgi:pyridoxine 4-dehydrogenase
MSMLVIQTAKELGVAVLGYSPIGRGILSGQIKKWDDIPEGDLRRMLTGFSPEVGGSYIISSHLITSLN